MANTEDAGDLAIIFRSAGKPVRMSTAGKWRRAITLGDLTRDTPVAVEAGGRALGVRPAGELPELARMFDEIAPRPVLPDVGLADPAAIEPMASRTSPEDAPPLSPPPGAPAPPWSVRSPAGDTGATATEPPGAEAAFKLAKAPVGLVVLLGAATAFAPLAIDMYLPGLPAIARGLHVPTAAAQATIAAFLAGLAIGQLFYGPASDRWGRRGPLIAGGVLFVVASIVCALAPSLPMLVAGRFVQALGGSAGTVIGRAVVRDRFDHRNAARVLSLLMLVMGLAPILAPLAGGVLVVSLGWRAIFWLLAVFGVMLTLAVVFYLTESRSAETAIQARGEHPFRAYLALLGQPVLVGYMLAGGLNGAALFTYISASPGLLITTYHIPPAHFGWVFCSNAVALVAMSQVNGHLLRHFTPERILSVARVISLGFALLLALAAFTGLGGMFGVLIPLFFILGSFGFIGANTTAAALNVDPVRAGSISSLMGVTTFGLGAAASALVSAFHDVGPRPMAFVVLLSIVGSAVALYKLAQPRPRASA